MSSQVNHLIDTHCHIDFDDFDTDRDLIIQQAVSLGVLDIIVPSVSQEKWHKTVNICTQYPQCHLALGLHPIFIDQHQPHHLLEMDQLIQSESPIAIGEIGLDYYLKELDQSKQQVYFSKQLVIAKQSDLPVIIHNRKAHDDCLSMLKDIGVNKGIIHAFNGSIQQAEKYIELGFLLGFGGMVTYQRSSRLRNLVKQIPLESIVLETDAPDMTVQEYQGGRNSPHYLPYVLQSIASIKNVSEQIVATTTTTNAQKLTLA